MSHWRAAAERRGRRGETIAAWYLRAHGWRIVARRLRLPMIEVDLVARRGDVLAVVEVKWRERAETAQLALRPAAVARLRAAATELAARESARGRPVSARVDLLALAPGAWPRHVVDIR
jgi:putative endonuclease